MNEFPSGRSRLRWWWPAIVMMTIIFVGSTDLGAMSHQSRLFEPLLRWLGLGEAAAHGVILGIRKLAHLAEYALLAIFAWRAWMLRPAFRPPIAWTWRQAVVPFLICFVYASLDEFHQWFVPSRGASPVDVMLDSVGALIGLWLLWLWHQSRLARGAD